MTEKHVTETFSQRQLARGIETAERLVFDEYTEAFQAYNSEPMNDGAAELITELERTLTALRVVRQVMNQTEMTDDEVKEIATAIPTEVASVDSLGRTGEETTSLLLDD